ncbi:hypothetical protein BGZ46_005004 [Entomortierella lignicola]|nr:hypothetical protein BGZ46_005004 [Entomortierella lignicola]
MRGHIVKKSARDIRQSYTQQYLKQFLRQVHPDLFQNYPKEQLRNSTSLQDLLPLVNHEKDTHLSNHHQHSSQSKFTKLVFYYKPNSSRPQPLSTSSDTSITSTQKKSQPQLESVEHSLPEFKPISPSSDSNDTVKQSILEQELKSWEMLQSFLELCRKVGVPVKDTDQKDVALQLELSKQQITAIEKKTPQASQKSLSEIFQEELQSSFAGSRGHIKSTQAWTGADGHASQTQLGKIGGEMTTEDAEIMIRSNPLLFQSPGLPKKGLRKVIRTWIHWQNEDQQLETSSFDGNKSVIPFHFGDWWRKVPIMVFSSYKESIELLETSGAKRGMLVVNQDMSKQEMTEYLRDNLERVQAEFKELIRSPIARSQDQKIRQVEQERQPERSPASDAESYIERMRMKNQFQNARARSTISRGRGSGDGGEYMSLNKRW